MKQNVLISILIFICLALVASDAHSQHYLSFENTTSLKRFFSHKPDNAIIISGHRGGREKGFPENSIEGFENVLSKLPAIFEIDPRLTKDSVIVLMHDRTLERTTTGKGKVSDYTWSELKAVRLKDSEGNITPFRIPLLEDVIIWSKGKTIVNLDKKDVPLHMITALIKKHDAEKHVMLTVHTGAQARYYYDRLPDVMFSVFARNEKEYEDIAISGVPWQNMIAYVGATIDEKNAAVVEKLRKNGVRCMVSFAPTHDKLETKEMRKEAYKKEIMKRPDIIETDIPIELGELLRK
ncbi:glycerophosphodiester phosphodiesterase family protein [Dysgonomonas sp. 511]|uniref:glycerophosphodiester phosphodiesterase family protein n=1 Tax=Dysgonomonas sp. 511 TaxID=2302930 RepID=UPI0013D38412|nr:glycerophosphodiester phosphodiesterase family protein [Dysgonomonas sp. 511]NDV78279.1 glycerophosphodiester phosphodiesterase [Dysgonomonas sp. 511]